MKTKTYPVGVDLADQEFILDPLSLPIRPRINPVKPFGALATCGDADIVQLRERGPASSRSPSARGSIEISREDSPKSSSGFISLHTMRH